MSNFNIELIKKSVKKNPKLWIAGVVGAGVLGFIAMRKKDNTEYGIMEYPELRDSTGPTDSGSVGGGVGYEMDLSGMEDYFGDILSQYGEYERDYIDKRMNEIVSGFSRDNIEKSAQVTSIIPYQDRLNGDISLQTKINNIVSTPTLKIIPDASYTDGQINLMDMWATEEKIAHSQGMAGTSKNVFSDDNEGLVIMYDGNNSVSFMDRNEWKTTLTPTTRKVIEREETRISESKKATTPEQKKNALGLTDADITAQKRQIAENPSIDFGVRDIRKLGLM